MIKNSKGETIVTWQMLVVVSLTSFGIYLGGVSSGYFLFRAEYQHKADARDRTVNEIKQKVDQLPQKTATEVNKVVREDEKK